METLDIQQTRNILQNLTNLEISYMEYSKSPKDFVKYQNFLEYFNNYIIRSKNLFRFYFPVALSPETIPSQKISSLIFQMRCGINAIIIHWFICMREADSSFWTKTPSSCRQATFIWFRPECIMRFSRHWTAFVSV